MKVVVHEYYDKRISTLAWGSLPKIFCTRPGWQLLVSPYRPSVSAHFATLGNHLAHTDTCLSWVNWTTRLPLCHIPSNGPIVPSPVHAQRLAYLLRFHPDCEFTSFVLWGLVEGFHLGYMPQQSRLRSSRHSVKQKTIFLICLVFTSVAFEHRGI